MRRAFVDTSGWLAFLDRKARDHSRVNDWFHAFQGRLVTTSDVVDEAVTWCNARLGHAVATALGKRIIESDDVHFVFVEEAFFEAGWKRFKERTDKGYSLTDCTSFIVMERLGLKEVVTLDKHFAQEGFRVVPG